MNIIVCVKQVPDTTDIKIDPETNTIVVGDNDLLMCQKMTVHNLNWISIPYPTETSQ